MAQNGPGDLRHTHSFYNTPDLPGTFPLILPNTRCRAIVYSGSRQRALSQPAFE